ncbi:unnamed protein product [Moneuplotes crassus]|uniref:Uncharacterized protein n=1 Tax=Euplotes crassus TaxID=5936 RepID=A0AAD1XLY1_EUPCR|nr:unnamed protein product [Moneuplotes crassus]
MEPNFMSDVDVYRTTEQENLVDRVVLAEMLLREQGFLSGTTYLVNLSKENRYGIDLLKRVKRYYGRNEKYVKGRLDIKILCTEDGIRDINKIISKYIPNKITTLTISNNSIFAEMKFASLQRSVLRVIPKIKKMLSIEYFFIGQTSLKKIFTIAYQTPLIKFPFCLLSTTNLSLPKLPYLIKSIDFSYCTIVPSHNPNSPQLRFDSKIPPPTTDPLTPSPCYLDQLLADFHSCGLSKSLMTLVFPDLKMSTDLVEEAASRAGLEDVEIKGRNQNGYFEVKV